MDGDSGGGGDRGDVGGVCVGEARVGEGGDAGVDVTRGGVCCEGGEGRSTGGGAVIGVSGRTGVDKTGVG